MKNKILSMIFAILMLICTTCNVFAAQGTDGDELHVVEAQKLEIQLGSEWAGVEFMLRTDAGVYPDVIPVDKTGVLSLEIGGSSTYTLSCLESDIPIPEFIELQAPVTSETESEKENLVEIEEVKQKIPTSHIIIFVVGIIAAIGVLVAIYVSNKKRRIVQNDEDDEDFE